MSISTNNSTTTSAFSSPSTSNSCIKILSNDDTEKAARTLAEAFSSDSLSKLLFCHIKDKKVRDQCELALYEAYLRQHISKGLCLGINESEEGFETVALWSLPNSVAQGLDSFVTLMEAGYGKVWNLVGEVGRQKVFHGMLPLLHDSCDRILSNDSRFKDKDVFTLVYLGSVDRARGKGNVRKMFDFMFENYVDKVENGISYLESSSINNIPIYERFGFKFYEDIVLGEKVDESSIEGDDYAIMNIMIRGSRGHDWTQDENTLATKGKL